MLLRNLALAGALMTVLAVPVAAQTTQSTPSKPTPTVTTAPPAGAMTAPKSATATKPSSSTMVDINSASPSELDALPGVGKARADAIIKNRPYKGKDDLLSRHVLPPNVYNAIKDKIIARQS